MHRELINLGGFQIYSYGALLALAFYLANLMGLAWARRLGYSEPAVENSIMTCILLGLAGSRLGYVLQNLGDYWNQPLQILNLRAGGLTIMGGVLFTLAIQWWRYHRQGKSVLNFFDFLAPALLVGMAFGRLGCLAHGCCFGDITQLPWGITYPEGVMPPGLVAGPRHPSQLYEMAGDLTLLALVSWRLPRLSYAGQNFYTFMLGYGIIRFLDEMTRHQEALLGPLTIYQWASLAMAAFGSLGLLGVFGRPTVDREIFARADNGAEGQR